MPYRLLIPLLIISALYGGSDEYARISDRNTCVKGVEDLIGASLKTYPSIQASRQMIIGADAQVEGAKWNYFPTPSVDLSLASGRRGTTLRIEQPLWTGGKIDATVDIALSKKAESEFALDESGYVLVETLLLTLQNYLQADGNLHALQEGKAHLMTLQKLLDRRIDAGVSSMADRELLKSRISQIDSDIAAAQIQRTMAHSQLELLVGERIECSISAEAKAGLTQDVRVDQMIDDMRATHPSLKKLSAQINTAEAEKARAKAAVWPTVSLRAEHQSGSVYYDQTTTNNLFYVAIQASPGAGLSAMSNIQSAEAKIQQAKYEKLTKEQELSNGIMRDYNDYHSSRERIDGMDKTIEASQNVLDSYTRLFVAGKRQWLDLVNSSRELTQNKIALSNLKAVFLSSSYILALKRGEMKLITEETK